MATSLWWRFASIWKRCSLYIEESVHLDRIQRVAGRRSKRFVWPEIGFPLKHVDLKFLNDSCISYRERRFDLQIVFLTWNLISSNRVSSQKCRFNAIRSNRELLGFVSPEIGFPSAPPRELLGGAEIGCSLVPMHRWIVTSLFLFCHVLLHKWTP